MTPPTYDLFLRDLPKDMRKKLLMVEVLAFMRRAMGLAEHGQLVLAFLIDEGNAAADAFPRAKGQLDPEVSCLMCQLVLTCTYVWYWLRWARLYSLCGYAGAADMADGGAP